MKTDTMYIIFNIETKYFSGTYTKEELHIAKQKLADLIRGNPGRRYHLMKRVTSGIANDITWEDSE